MTKCTDCKRYKDGKCALLCTAHKQQCPYFAWNPEIAKGYVKLYHTIKKGGE